MKIIPVFVPHIGCPNDCAFCNQKRITGKGTVIANAKYVSDIVEECRKTIDEKTYTELAFFGGSFTAIDLRVQEELLKVGKHYKDMGVVQSIRCSTRPDAISNDKLELLKKYDSLENILDNSSELKGKLKEKVENGKENAILSKKLAKIITNGELNIDFEEYKQKKINSNEIKDFLKNKKLFNVIKILERENF